MIRQVQSFIAGAWVAPGSGARPIESAVSGEVIAEAGGTALDFGAALGFARERGGAALRAMSFHDRARMLKALAEYLNDRREALYEDSYSTGATLRDHRVDIDGGIGTCLVFASKARRELPDATVWADGAPEWLGRTGAFQGLHIRTPRPGAAVQINAYNFPVWGMLEKLAPAIIAGMPSIVKPATATSYVTETAVRMILASGLLPEGALQLVAGDIGGLLDRLDPQDHVAFTGSAATALTLRSHPNLLAGPVPFTAEADSLNASILGADAAPGTPEFDLFVKEAVREMTVKAGQKCTAIRRMLAPEALVAPLAEALTEKLALVRTGDPRDSATTMGALVSRSHRDDVLARCDRIAADAETLFEGAAPDRGGFLGPRLYLCRDPDAARAVHDTEAFGPVATLMPYRDLAHASALANRGGGSLVTSLVTRDAAVAREVILATAAWHGRVYVTGREAAPEATGHGAPMPQLIHGGPGRAGGGEELGGMRAVAHYMARTAVQGSPGVLSELTGTWMPGAPERSGPAHPFARGFAELAIGETLVTAPRTITLEDIEHFAAFTGDTFYAHMDEEAAKRNPFFPGRVAHGYLILSFAAGLFVEPSEGPVLANTGLDGLRFLKPVSPGTAIRVRLTVKAKTRRTPDYGEVRWQVTVLDGTWEPVAEYELLTMVKG